MKLTCKLKNCYGIQELKQDFDFSKCKTVAIYASNGVMKTSFARTFSQLQQKLEPKDELHGLKSEYNIKFGDNAITNDNIFVIKPYLSKYESENMSTLLVDENRKKEYDETFASILSSKKSLTSALNKASGVKQDEIEKTILSDFEDTNGDFFEFLGKIVITDNDCVDVKYSAIFNDKVLELLKDKTVTDNIQHYTEQYNKLLDNSPYFGKGAFNPSKADSVLSTLTKESFFKSNHKVQLHSETELLGEAELKNKFDEAKKSILQNAELKKIQELITKEAKVKELQALLEDKPNIINELLDLNSFKKKLWMLYFKKNEQILSELLKKYQENKQKLSDIEEAASNQSTMWRNVVKIFEQRFKVPFELDIENKKSAILGKENPNIVFKFKDKNGQYKALNRDKLENIDILSQGERRALYLLQMIFEIENRARNNAKTLFIVDDIADSFDYKNKYAIIEYLKELPHKAPDRFYQIILTHNFDFFRTVQERILTNVYKREYSFIAQKNDGGILLLEAGDKNVVSPFIYWKNELKANTKNYKFLIAMIPFIRELISCTARNDGYYNILTSLLHVKDDTKTIKISTIKAIYKDVLGIDLGEEDACIFNKLCDVANGISNDNTEDNTLNLENKVILSIATRLMAEYYMQSCGIVLEDKIGDTFDKFKKQFLHDNTKSKAISLLEKVVIMTPENIHLNSFMYEPILDMSDWHLRELYQNIREIIPEYIKFEFNECIG